jgi:hypothetical protein
MYEIYTLYVKLIYDKNILLYFNYNAISDVQMCCDENKYYSVLWKLE